MSDYKGAALMLDALPNARAMLGDWGYDADWFRATLTAHGITPCIPSKANRKAAIPQDRTLPSAPSHRKHVRQAQGQAAHPHPIRSLRAYVHVRHLHRPHRHLLAVINEF